MNRRLSKCVNIADLQRLAKRRLPRALYDYIDGTAEDGVSGRANRSSFDHYQLVPRTLVDVSKVESSTSVFGQKMSSPIILCPTAFTRAFHHHGETAVAKAAKEAGLIYSLSTVSNTSLEDIASIDGPRWFQIYVYKDRSLVKDLIDRCKLAKYQALILTVDASTPGNREHDLRNGLTVPPKPSLATILDAVKHPYWCWHMLTSPAITTANIKGNSALDAADTKALLRYMHEQLDISVDWDDVAWMMAQWQGPFLIKGILSVEDAIRAADLGVHGIVISNHGGRQLDHVPATLDVLPEIVEAVGDRCEIIVDSGFRRGTDIIKALALGAKACMIGRPYLYGLAAGGEAGVKRALQILDEEFKRNMRLLGCTSVSQ
ncbi:MAG: L-lactate dehydrogenase (cytochrome), partial [Gammaproteobacteria bacterium]